MTRAASFFRGRQIVFLASIDWDAAWQRHQTLAEAFQAEGAEVFFVENTGFRGFATSDFFRVLGRLKRLFKPLRRRSNRRIISPMVLPPTHEGFRLLNSVYFVPLLLSKLRKLGLRPRPTVFAYLPTATTLQLLDGLDPDLLVYDCVDNFFGHPNPPKDLPRTENELLQRAQLVLTTSSFLERQKSKQHPVVRRIHHGVPEEFLRPPQKPLPRYERFCYFGTLWNALDYEAVRGLAERGFRVDLIGPVKEAPPPFPKGVRILKPVKHDQLPRKLAGYDALLLPYADNKYNRGVVPAKLYECLSTGKPILCSALPSLRDYEGLVEIANRAEDFVKIAERLPETETSEKSRRRIDAAAERSTPHRVRRIANELKAVRIVSPKNPHRPSPQKTEEALLRGFSWIAVWFIAAKVVSIVTQFAAGRWLGPHAFGLAHLVIAIAAIVQTGISLGFPLTLTRFGASADSASNRKKTISTILLCFLAWASLFSFLLSQSERAATSYFDIDRRLWFFVILLATLTSIHHTLGGALQGLRKFIERGIAEAIYAFGALTAVVSAIILGRPSTDAFIGSLIVGLLFGSLYAFAKIANHLKAVLDKRVVLETLPFASLGTLNILSITLIQAPGRIASFHFESSTAAGIFSVYFTATMQVALAIGNMLQAVLIPIASKESGQRDAWAFLRTFNMPIGAAVFAGFCMTALTATTLMGAQYPTRLHWIFLFAFSASLSLLHGTAASLFAARDVHGLLISTSGSLITGISNAALTLLLVPRWGIAGAGSALALSYAAGLTWFLFQMPTQKMRPIR